MQNFKEKFKEKLLGISYVRGTLLGSIDSKQRSF